MEGLWVYAVGVQWECGGGVVLKQHSSRYILTIFEGRERLRSGFQFRSDNTA